VRVSDDVAEPADHVRLELHEGGGVWAYLLDATAVVGLGGLWFHAFTRALADRPLLPLGEPDLREILEPARG